MSNHRTTSSTRTKSSTRKERRSSRSTEDVGSGDSNSPSSSHHRSHGRRRGHNSRHSSHRRRASSSSRSSSSSSSSSSSISTDLSSPPRAFPKRAPIKPGQRASYQVNYKKSRWEPITAEEERKRLASVKKLKRREKKRAKRMKKKRSRKELVDDFHKENDRFRPLTEFLKHRRRMAEELLDSLDLETRFAIFPEIRELADDEAHDVVYGVLKGMSRKRVLAVMKGDDFSDSSSTEVDEDDFSDGGALPSTSTAQHNRSNSHQNNHKHAHPAVKKERPRRKKPKLRLKRGRNGEELEEGEILSNSDAERAAVEEESSYESEEEEMTPKVEEVPSATEEEEELLRQALLSRKARREKMQQQQRELNQNGVEEEKAKEENVNGCNQQEGASISASKEVKKKQANGEPTFIISLDYSPPKKNVEEDEDDIGIGIEQITTTNKKSQAGFQQRVVCILPTSPIAQNEEGDEVEAGGDELKIDQEEESIVSTTKFVVEVQEEGQIPSSEDEKEAELVPSQTVAEELLLVNGEPTGGPADFSFEEPNIEFVDD